MSYVYVLKNPAYEAYIVKIGKTKLDPYIRAQQIYWGATGVPEHFDIAFVCKVPDCNIAEKIFINYFLLIEKTTEENSFIYL